MAPPRSSLRAPGRHITIITTASLPWRTGTAVNPLLRAAYLAHIQKECKVLLLIPWLAESEQFVYPEGIRFRAPAEQEDWVRAWVEKRTGFPSDFDIKFYPGRYDYSFLSIFPVGDPTKYVPDELADVAILEEPEHLTWFHHGRRYTEKFKHVVGIVHTNYIDYVRRGGKGTAGGPLAARIVSMANKRMCSIHTHKVIKLSNAVQDLPRQSTHYVHGVSPAFLEVGDRMAAAQQAEARGAAGQPGQPEERSDRSTNGLQEQEMGSRAVLSSRPSVTSPLPSSATQDSTTGGQPAAATTVRASSSSATQTRHAAARNASGADAQAGGSTAEGGAGQVERGDGASTAKPAQESFTFTKGCYFLGKAVWGKGYTELLDMLGAHRRAHGWNLPVDVYGSGEDWDDIKARAAELELAVSFLGGRDHLDESLHHYRVFVNPSLSDVVATTSAEALAMGKWLVCPQHPSNSFFATFHNTLTYRSPAEFSRQLDFAENNDPQPLTPEDRKRLTWEAATERLLDVASIEEDEWPNQVARAKDWIIWRLVYAGNGIEPIRWIIGAGRGTAGRRSPEPLDLDDWTPKQRFIMRDYGGMQLAQGYPPPRTL